MTAPLVTPSLDALARGLHDLYCGSNCETPEAQDYENADALLASGVVRAADTLAAIEELVARWEREAAERGPDDTLYTAGVAAILRAALSLEDR